MILGRLVEAIRSRDKEPPVSQAVGTVAGIFMGKGEVLIRVSKESEADEFSLSVNGMQSAFEPICEADALAVMGRQTRLFKFVPLNPVDLSSLPKLTLSMKPKIAVSANPDWAVPGSPTLQVGLKAGAMPLELPVDGEIEIPPHDEPLLFSVGLAVHRGKGKLIVELRSEARVVTQSIVFDPKMHGGRRLDSFQNASIVLPASADKAALRMTISAEAPESESVKDTYFFIVEPRVSSLNNGTVTEESVELMDVKTDSETKWLRASPSTRVALSSDVSLITPDGAKSVMEASNCAFKLHEDRGHTIVLSASEQGRYSFFIDGKFAFSHNIGTDPTVVRIPPKYLNGAYRLVSIWDLPGLREHFSLYVLCPQVLTPKDVLEIEGKPPFPAPLSSPSYHRYLGLKSQLAEDVRESVRSQAGYCLNVLERGHSKVELKPLMFPKIKEPDVSIIVPAHNKVEITYVALCSLLFARNRASFEVILVDDASTDETSRIEEFISGIRVVRNETPERFIRSCNQGAEQAKGRFLVFLNNDVEVTAGWLDELVSAFSRFENVGIAGSKLLFPDGRLQDAGGLVWKTGNPWNYGYGQNPGDPRFCYARQVDYLSGAALMTTRDIWNEVGGFSDYLEPMYFEDTDLSFKIRKAGYTTWFVPSSIVYHYEGATSGTDTSSGFKQFQEVNRPKFKRRWAKAFRGHGEEGVNPDLEKDRGIVGRVLFIDHGMPRPDRDAGGFAAMQEMRLVQSLGYKVTFLPQNLAHLGGYTEDLDKSGIEAVYAPFYLSVEEYLEQNASAFDAFFITRYYVAEAVLPILERVAPKKRVIFNNADLHFLRELRAALEDGSAEGIEAAQETRRKEVEVMRRVDLVLSYNDVEHAVITSHTDGETKIAKCPWVVTCPDDVPDLEGRQGLSFLGNFKHYPNAQAVDWFVENVVPRIATQGQAALFNIYGSGMSDEIRAHAGDAVAAIGYVEDVADAYDKHRVFVAPLMSGAGIKGKVLHAMAHGIPSVLTPIAAEGTGLRDGIDCIIARTPGEWEKAILELLENDERWRQISASSRKFILDNYSFKQGKMLMGVAFEAIGLF